MNRYGKTMRALRMLPDRSAFGEEGSIFSGDVLYEKSDIVALRHDLPVFARDNKFPRSRT